MEYQKITSLLGNTSDKVARFLTKNGLKFMINHLEKHTILTSK